MREEEPVAVPQLLELLRDDAGKEGSHLFKKADNGDFFSLKNSPIHQLEQFQQDQR